VQYKPFAIVPEAMAAAQVISGWTKHRYREARGILVRLGRLELVSEGGRRRHDPHLYRLRTESF
jgi:hypothetical protein